MPPISSPTPAIPQSWPRPWAPRLNTTSLNRVNSTCAAPPPLAHPTPISAMPRISGLFPI